MQNKIIAGLENKKNREVFELEQDQHANKISSRAGIKEKLKNCNCRGLTSNKK